MTYFTDEFGKFFRALKKNNNRDWFHANKKRYEEHVKDPFYRLIEDVVTGIQKIDSEIQVEPKNAVFRINRDIRFSKDKSPYKAHVAAVVSKHGRKDMQYPGLYLHLGSNELSIAGGCYCPDKDNLTKIRKALMHDIKSYRKLVIAKKFKDTFGELNGARNKVLPKEFKSHQEDIPELFLKDFHYLKSYSDNKLITNPKLDQFIVDHFKTGYPLNQWLKDRMY